MFNVFEILLMKFELPPVGLNLEKKVKNITKIPNKHSRIFVPAKEFPFVISAKLQYFATKTNVQTEKKM